MPGMIQGERDEMKIEMSKLCGIVSRKHEKLLDMMTSGG